MTKYQRREVWLEKEHSPYCLFHIILLTQSVSTLSIFITFWHKEDKQDGQELDEDA